MDEYKLSNSKNRLGPETSPYLQQHAENPVNWYPWGEDAIEMARKHDKPILLSIGYSSCHWCHVMMHESFMDPEIAATMNRLFINIKVDKEERPDLDKIYQTVYQLLMGQGGGWPLTMFLSPITLVPFFGATYIQKKPEEKEVLGFEAMLHRLSEVYYHEKEKVRQQELHTMAVLQVISQLQQASHAPLAKDLIHQAEMSLLREFDPEHGGFGGAAKFPNCPTLEFILHSTETLTRHVALSTLNTMANGGIYDQLGGGFFRYTVDPLWQIPHFEKMLYDNAQLIGIYAQAYKITQHSEYRDIVFETVAWLANTMLDPNTNGFYTAIDADSEGEEGLYYIWDLQEIKQNLSHDDFVSIKKYYNLDHRANFESKWHLFVNPEVPAPPQLTQIKQQLLQLRNARTAPALDKMILTGWNGLAIKGLSIAGIILQHQPFLDLAANTIKFIKECLYVDGQLYATWQNGKPKIGAFLDDYAFVLDGLLTYINGDAKHDLIPFCRDLADTLIANFYDVENHGFFFTSRHAEQLFYRPKTFADDSIPSGNGVACVALLRLGLLIDHAEYIEIAKQTVKYALIYLNEAPEIHLSMIRAYEIINDTNSQPQTL